MLSNFVGCMLAHEFAEKRITFPCSVEDKIDGVRIVFAGGEAFTRNGRVFPTLKAYADILASAVPEGVLIDGEAKAQNWNDSVSLLKRIKNIDHERIAREVTIHIFDAFSAQTIESKEPYSERRKAIEWLGTRLEGHRPHRFVIVPSKIVNSRAELDEAFADALRRGAEGLMVKSLDGLYTPKRSWAWMKIKPFRDITVKILSISHGWGLCPECMTKEKREQRAHYGSEFTRQIDPDDMKPDPSCPTCRGAAKGVPRPDLLGALTCVDDEGNEWGVGMGFTDADKRALMESPPIGRRCDVKIQDEGSGGNDITGRHAVFLRFRDVE